jgi:hypothetical protein
MLGNPLMNELRLLERYFLPPPIDRFVARKRWKVV